MRFDDLPDFIGLTRDLCGYATGVVADDNEPMFARLTRELPLAFHRWPSGEESNGWTVPDNWRVERALLYRDDRPIFDGTSHALAVARYSRSFRGELSWEELRPHIVSNPELPDAHMFHCMWQYRPWDADWALCLPWSVARTLGPGRYRVELETRRSPGEMIAAVHDKPGRSDRVIVFNAHTCHPNQANDGFAAVAVLIRLFQWLAEFETEYTYRLVLAPEHLGTVFYLRDREPGEIERMVCGVFPEMGGTGGPVRVCSTLLGGLTIDAAFANVLRHHARAHVLSPWRCGAGNDETVWEAPGYEVPFVELTRSERPELHYPEYHSSRDTPDLMDPGQLLEFYRILQRVIEIFETDSLLYRRFDGLICLSNPRYDLYLERFDPTVDKALDADAETWGHLLDSLLRYFDGSMSVLDIAERHRLPYDRLLRYLRRFEEKGLIDMEFRPMKRPPISVGRGPRAEDRR